MASDPNSLYPASLVVLETVVSDDVDANSQPKSSGINIDVYLQPLINELKELWKSGVDTWDAKLKKKFTLRAMLLWTINDFPTYAMLFGWSTKERFACPYCHKNTDYLWLKYGHFLPNKVKKM